MDDWFGTMLDGLFATDLQSLDFREVLPRRKKQSDSFLVGISPPSPAGIPRQIYDLKVVWKLLGKVKVCSLPQLESQFLAYRFQFANEYGQYIVGKQQAISPKNLLDSVAVRMGSRYCYIPYSLIEMPAPPPISEKAERFALAQIRLRRRRAQRILDQDRADDKKWRERKECC